MNQTLFAVGGVGLARAGTGARYPGGILRLAPTPPGLNQRGRELALAVRSLTAAAAHPLQSQGSQSTPLPATVSGSSVVHALDPSLTLAATFVIYAQRRRFSVIGASGRGRLLTQATA